MLLGRTRCATAQTMITAWTSLLLAAPVVNAQLTDEAQTAPHVTRSAIAKSLQEQIGAGQGNLYRAGSSIYLIKRDPARAIRRGRQLFQRKFTLTQGQGPRVNSDSTGDMIDTPSLGAGLSDSCASCHGRPKGSAGFGGLVATRPDSRDAPHLFGLGLQEMLADEITRDLRALQSEAIQKASEEQRSIVMDLNSKGINYGTIIGRPDGSSDTSGVNGVAEDLRVRPFFAEGAAHSLVHPVSLEFDPGESLEHQA